MTTKLDSDLATEVKALVVLAFRNGPMEALHAGSPCECCSGKKAVSHISDAEMKTIMKSAVDTLYRLLWQRDRDPEAYKEALAFGRRQTFSWDNPEFRNGQQRMPKDAVVEKLT